jgi:hypothetical protein
MLWLLKDGQVGSPSIVKNALNRCFRPVNQSTTASSCCCGNESRVPLEMENDRARAIDAVPSARCTVPRLVAEFGVLLVLVRYECDVTSEKIQPMYLCVYGYVNYLM